MTFTITVADVLWFLASLAGIALLVYLTITVSRINSVLKDVQRAFEKNKNNIDKTIASLPDIAANIKGITTDIKEGVETIAITAENIEKTVSKSTATIVDKTEMAVDYVQIAGEVIRSILYFIKKKK